MSESLIGTAAPASGVGAGVPSDHPAARYTYNFALLSKLLPELASAHPGDHHRQVNSPHPPIDVTVLPPDHHALPPKMGRRRPSFLVCLAHVREASSSVVFDPQMLVAVYLDRQQAEAITLSMSSKDTYEFAYDQASGHLQIGTSDALNEFLENWLLSLVSQGFQPMYLRLAPLLRAGAA